MRRSLTSEARLTQVDLCLVVSISGRQGHLVKTQVNTYGMHLEEFKQLGCVVCFPSYSNRRAESCIERRLKKLRPESSVLPINNPIDL